MNLSQPTSGFTVHLTSNPCIRFLRHTQQNIHRVISLILPALALLVQAGSAISPREREIISATPLARAFSPVLGSWIFGHITGIFISSFMALDSSSIVPSLSGSVCPNIHDPNTGEKALANG